jgi:hypothetical protein
VILQNIKIYLPNEIALHSRSLESSDLVNLAKKNSEKFDLKCTSCQAVLNGDVYMFLLQVEMYL